VGSKAYTHEENRRKARKNGKTKKKTCNEGGEKKGKRQREGGERKKARKRVAQLL